MFDPGLNQKRDQLVAGAHPMPASVIVRFQRVPFPDGASYPPVFRYGTSRFGPQFQRQHPSAVGLVGDGLGHSPDAAVAASLDKQRTSRHLFGKQRQGRTYRERAFQAAWRRRPRLSGRLPMGTAAARSHRKSPDKPMCSQPTGEVWTSRSSGTVSPMARKWVTASAI
jgi:hypothetical protein